MSATPSPSSSSSQRLVLPSLPGWPEPEEPLWFEVDGAESRLEVSADLLAGVYLLPAMAVGRDLILPSTLDPQLAEQLPQAVELLAHWFEPLQPIRIRTDSSPEPDDLRAPSRQSADGRETGCFFTGGVDSFRTLQRNLDRTDALVFVFGLDVQENNPNLWSQTADMLAAAAEETGKRLIVVRTNLRQHLDRAIPWELSHGTALAAVARLLQNELKEVLIASTHADHQLIPWGSHPELDQQWSTRRQKFTHDGTEEERWQKIWHLLAWPLACQWLRVCTWNTGDTYNCGRCSKCLRTMTALHLLNADGRVPTLPDHLDLEMLRGLTIRSAAEQPFLEELERKASEAGESKKELASILRGLLEQPDLPQGHAPRHLARLPLDPLEVGLAAFHEEIDRWTWVLELQWGGRRHELRIQLEAPGFPPRRDDIAEAALVMLTPLAMHLGVPLKLADDLPVDAELVERIEYHQHLLARMPKQVQLRETPLLVRRREPAQTPGLREPVLAAAFSGGVDANTLAACCDPRPVTLVYVHGLEMENQSTDRKTKAEERVRAAAACHNLPVSFIDTNLRDVLIGGFGMHWSIGCRVGVHAAGHLLAGHINTLAIASDVTPARLVEKSRSSHVKAAGIFIDNHPLLFEMNSSSRVRQEYWEDGRIRMERLAVIDKVPGCLSRIWVCQEEAKGLYHGEKPNCGRCEKCLRTMLSMLAGLDQPDFTAFEAPLDWARVSKIGDLRNFARMEWLDIRTAALHRFGADSEIYEVLDEVLERTGLKREQRLAWARDRELLTELRANPEYAKWLKHCGEPLAGQVFGDKPAKRMMEWLDDSRGWKAFRRTALQWLLTQHPADLERWLKRARMKRLLRLDP